MSNETNTGTDSVCGCGADKPILGPAPCLVCQLAECQRRLTAKNVDFARVDEELEKMTESSKKWEKVVYHDIEVQRLLLARAEAAESKLKILEGYKIIELKDERDKATTMLNDLAEKHGEVLQEVERVKIEASRYAGNAQHQQDQREIAEATCATLRDEVARMEVLLDADNESGPFCTGCKVQFPGMSWEQLQAHVRECPDHPLCKALVEIKGLRGEVAARGATIDEITKANSSDNCECGGIGEGRCLWCEFAGVRIADILSRRPARTEKGG